VVLALGALLLAAAVVFFVLQPLVGGQSSSLERSDEELSEVEARRRVRLLALRDVEYDFQAGKLDESDYRSLKRELSAEALEALESSQREARGEGSAGLEAEIAAVRDALVQGTVCSTCGHPNPKGSRFCSGCGSRLVAHAGAPDGAEHGTSA
jgi:cytochrome c-type biogenesis protein CcmI